MSKAELEENKARRLNRRNFLKIVGGGVIVAAAGVGVFAGTRTPHKAIEPWKLAVGPRKEADPRRAILSHAILAPNPHNRQPWVVDLSVENEMVLYCDLDRRLPQTDPFDRQITIGLGCFLELADLAAKEFGYNAIIKTFPEGESFPRLDGRPVAKIRLEESPPEKDPLFAHVFDRRSNKDPFDTGRTVSETDAANIVAAGRHNTSREFVLDAVRVAKLREITWAALDLEMSTFRTAKESIDLMRIGKAEIEANPDGIDIGGPFMEGLSLLGQFSREKMLEAEVGSAFFKQAQAAQRPPLDTAMGYVFVKTDNNTRQDQISAGRDYVRLNLQATGSGISMHPLSQSLQEFEEMKPHFKAIRDELGIEPDKTLQMFARIGYGDQPAPSPRWRFETRLRQA